jgi:hypothetical protein
MSLLYQTYRLPKDEMEMEKKEEEDFDHKILRKHIKQYLKGSQHEITPPLAQAFYEAVNLGISFNKLPKVFNIAVKGVTGVSLQELNLKLDRKTVKMYYLGLSNLKYEALVEAIQEAEYITVAADESKRSGCKLFPICVQFWYQKGDCPYYGLFCVQSMQDKTAETMAKLLFSALVDVTGITKQVLNGPKIIHNYPILCNNLRFLVAETSSMVAACSLVRTRFRYRCTFPGFSGSFPFSFSSIFFL